MNLLLDTHVLIWTLLDDDLIGARQRDLINDPENVIFVSSASIFEMSINAGLGKLGLPLRYKSNLTLIHDDFDFRTLPVSAAHANGAGFLRGNHRDPFDRLLAAQSIVEQMPIMTVDARLKELGAEVVW